MQDTTKRLAATTLALWLAAVPGAMAQGTGMTGEAAGEAPADMGMDAGAGTAAMEAEGRDMSDDGMGMASDGSATGDGMGTASNGGMGVAAEDGAMDGAMGMASEDGGMMDGEMGGMEGMEGPDPLHVFFDTGSARISPDQEGVLDAAVRTFRDGNWIVIEVAGVADTVGRPDANLDLSLRRARAVLDGLVARGVDPLQLQLRARGNSELEVRTEAGVAERANCVAEITWR